MADHTSVLMDTLRRALGNKNKGAVSAMIFSGEKVLYSMYSGWIDKEKKLRPQADSLFMIGSNTKVMTALGLFRLIEDGKLSLDDPITEYIPEFSVRSRIGEYTVTVADLLMHRAGIQCDLYPYIMGTEHTYEEVPKALNDTYRTSAPGTMYAYSNLGYSMLGLIAERVAGKPYTEFMQEALFGPLGMEVYFAREEDLPASVSDRVARCYDRKGKRITDPLGVLTPAGAFTYTTMESLSKIGQLLMNDGRVGDVQLYRPETIQFMKTLKINDEWDRQLAEVGYGIYHHRNVLEYETGRILGHGGATMFHHSRFDFLEKEKIGVILFTNYETAAQHASQVELALLNAYLKEEGFKKKEIRHVFRDFDPKQYARRYDTQLGPIAFRESAGGLAAKIKGVDFDMKLDEEGWFEAFPKPFWAKLPPFSKQMKGLRLCQTKYLGQDVLLVEQDGIKQAVGEPYYKPELLPAWVDAQGTYEYPDRSFKYAIEKAVLSVEGDDLILTAVVETQKSVTSLAPVNDTEAIIKGFGRNMKETVFLKKEGGRYELTAMGLTLVRTKSK